MEYFLAIDKGEYEKSYNRYTKLPLQNLNLKNLTGNNNFKALCKFTLTFNNATELKDFLIAKKLLHEKDRYKKLVIFYYGTYKNRSYQKALSIPYKYHEKYFEFETLAMIIKNRALANPEFLDNFLHNLNSPYYFTKEYYLLLDMAHSYYTESTLYDTIRSYLNHVCTEKRGERYVFNYRKLYNFAMLMASFDNLHKEIKPEAKPPKKEEELTLSRTMEDNQLSLF